MFHAPLTSPALEIAFSDSDCGRDLPGTPLQQSATYAKVLASFGCASSRADVYAGSALIGRARVYLRRAGPLRLAWMPRGPVWSGGVPADLCAHAAAALPRAAPWRALWASSADADRAQMGIPVAHGLQLAELDLRPDEASRRAAQHGKWRNRLARAEEARLSVTARPLNIACDAPLLRKELAQRKARRYAALPSAFTERWAMLAPDASLMMTASEGETPVAFMLLLLHGDGATYHIGWTGARGRSLSAHNLLLWRASCILSGWGYARIDLGRTDSARTPGITRFKLGAGAVARSIGPTRLRLGRMSAAHKPADIHA